MKLFKPNVEMMEEKKDIDGLIMALRRKKDSVIASNAALALGRLRASSAVKPLIEALDEEDSSIRMCATMALGMIKALDAVDPLIRSLQDKEDYVREEAARALGKIGDRRGFRSLTRALKDKYANVRQAAEEALKKVSGHAPARFFAYAERVQDYIDLDDYLRERVAHPAQSMSRNLVSKKAATGFDVVKSAWERVEREYGKRRHVTDLSWGSVFVSPDGLLVFEPGQSFWLPSGEWLWVFFAIGDTGKWSQDEIPLAVVDAFCVSFVLTSRYSGKVSAPPYLQAEGKLWAQVQGEVLLSENQGITVKGWFEDHRCSWRPQWERRSDKIRSMIG